LSANEEIEANGVFVIGQEQDSVGGDFSESEAFIGKLGSVSWQEKKLPKNTFLNCVFELSTWNKF
jgi:CUB/sushi domain-containing protein